MTNIPPNADQHSRIAALDGFRGFAILIVTLYRFGNESLTAEVIGKLPSKAIHVGASGVDFFFVLSGFLITGILLKTRSSEGYFSRFYINRSVRIFPLYYAALLFLLVLLPMLGQRKLLDGLEGNPLHLWIYTTNLSISWHNAWCYSSLDHFWSLAIEEQFYLVWPFAVYYLGPRRLFHTCWVLFVGLATTRIGCSIGDIGEVTEKSFTLFRLDGLLLGSIAAILLSESRPIISNYRFLRWGFAISAVCYMASLVAGPNDFTVRYSLVSMLATFLLLQILASPAGSVEKRFFENSILRSLGKYSYAMYVFQNPLILLLSQHISPQSIDQRLGNAQLAAVAYVVTMLTITYLLAVVSWYCFERWMLKLRR